LLVPVLVVTWGAMPPKMVNGELETPALIAKRVLNAMFNARNPPLLLPATTAHGGRRLPDCW